MVPLLRGGALEQEFVVLPEALGQVPQGFLAGLPLVRDVRDEVSGNEPLALLPDVDDGLHDQEWMGGGLFEEALREGRGRGVGPLPQPQRERE